MATLGTTPKGGGAIRDVSFAGSTISIDGIVITDFMDQENPIDIQDTEVSNVEWDLDGEMVATVKPSAILVSVTVIPGSESDKALRKIWSRGFCNSGNMALEDVNRNINCDIKAKSGARGGALSYSFGGGVCVSGAAGVTANGQGKMGGNTYTFAFSRLK